MSACAECKLSLNRSAKDKVVCSHCKLIFHGKCLGLSEAELKIILSTSWSCKMCLSKLKLQCSNGSDSTPVKGNVSGASASSQPTMSMDWFKSAMLDLKNEILSGQTRLEQSLQSCLDKLETYSDIVSKQGELIKTQQNIILSLQSENAKMKKSVERLDDRLDMLEQYGRRNTLEIHGVPAMRDENVADLVIATCKAVGVVLGPQAIDCTHRLPMGGGQRTPGIVARFVRREDADRVLRGKKEVRRLSTRVAGFPGEEQPIFINLSLTARRRGILAQAKRLQKERGFKYVWVDRTGNVKIRPVHNGKVFTIRTENELDSVTVPEYEKGL
jgi:hypothetical protein